MKLLLTSGGITNKKISSALNDLVGKSAKDITIAFIPTAANAIDNDKSWYIDDLHNLSVQHYKKIDIVDISALPKDVWLPRLKQADVLFFSGGSTTHLMRWIRKSGLIHILPKLLKNKVYAGISAGSNITAPTLKLSDKKQKKIYKEKFKYETNKGLGLVKFYFRPHLNSPEYSKVRKDKVAAMAKNMTETIYALDDQMALKVVNDKIEVVGEGEYLVFNK